MKIFYAVQATGNGHISRATQLYPYLQKFGTVDFFLSGNNASLHTNLPVKYKSEGCSLHYSKCGGLQYWDIIKNVRPTQIYKDAQSLPLKNYDVIINDFESITALACKLQKVKSVQFGHQASFHSNKTPRPEKESIIGEMILKHYAPATQYLGLHFNKYDSFIHEPVIKDEILHAQPTDLGHITVYLPSFQKDCLENAFKKIPSAIFHWFLEGVTSKHQVGNIVYYPISQEHFNQSLITCHGIITGGGFETPAEALFLEKRILSIPIREHYEQLCNAVALQKMGVPVIYAVDDYFNVVIEQWLNQKINLPKLHANNIPNTLQYLFDTYHQ